MKIDTKKINIWILVFTVVYLICFVAYYISTKNYEFLWYIAIMTFLIFLMIELYKRYNFHWLVLLSTSIWGLMHMLGGSVYLGGVRLYDFVLIPIASGEIVGTDIFRYDQFAHLYFYFICAFILYTTFIRLFKKDASKGMILTLIVIAGIGIGAINEILEFVPVLLFGNTGVGDYFNTLWDLVFNAFGIILGVIYIGIFLNKKNYGLAEDEIYKK